MYAVGGKVFEGSGNRIIEALRHVKGYNYSGTLKGVKERLMPMPTLVLGLYTDGRKEMSGSVHMQML